MLPPSLAALIRVCNSMIGRSSIRKMAHSRRHLRLASWFVDARYGLFQILICIDEACDEREHAKYPHDTDCQQDLCRHLIRCQIVSRMDFSQVRAVCEAAMREYGMPSRSRTDNGAPFAEPGLLGLSKFPLTGCILIAP